MVRQDILGGLRAAKLRGQTLKQSMMSFYRAGYKKQDIEEAARAFQKEGLRPVATQIPKKTQKKSGIKSQIKPTQKISNYGEKSKQEKKPELKQVQKVSNYDTTIKQKKDSSIIILVIVLILLLAGLAGIFIFRESVIDFFNNLFS